MLLESIRVGQLSEAPAPTVLAKAAVAFAHYSIVFEPISRYIYLLTHTANQAVKNCEGCGMTGL